MYTTEAKLDRLRRTKSDIITAIQLGGIEVPVNTPFSEFPEYIKQLAPFADDTTTLSDLMLLADLYVEVNSGAYNEHVYTERDETELMDLVNLILEGEIVNE